MKMYNPKEDPVFQNPYIDIEEERVRNEITFCYIHGGFEGTNVKFSFCFPKKENYQGRFFHFLSPFPGPDEEMASLERTGLEDHITFALTHGAYFVETNMGSGSSFGDNNDPTMLYRSSAAAAEYSRETAVRLYGCPRPYGYVYGGSGGGYKTCGCIENTTAFDGAVPFVTACPVALPNIMSVTAHARRILRNKLDWIQDAVEPGSTHDIYSGLNEEERAAFDEVSKMGMPLDAWINFKHADEGGFAVIAPVVRQVDPEYFTDFWTKPGYLGTEEHSTAVRDRVRFQTRIKEVCLPEKDSVMKVQKTDSCNGVDTAWQKMLMESGSEKPYLVPEELPDNEFDYMFGMHVHFLTGKAKGNELTLKEVEKRRLIIEKGYGQGTVEDILSQASPGDEILIDNSDYIAIQTYHRYQVPDAEFTVWDQFRNEDGTPQYPQRENLLCMGFAYQGAGSIQSGDIKGKVIMVNCLADGGACTWMADWYRSRVAEKYGGETDQWFRLWCLEHCAHTDQEHTADPFHISSYLGVLYQALLDLSAWVELGRAPAETTAYQIIDGQAFIPPTAEERKGIQPVVDLKANGGKAAKVRTGESVFFGLEVGIADEDSTVRSIEWSFEGEGYAPGGTEAEHTYQSPGTYFAVVRVKTNRNDDPCTAIQNLDRVRILVE